MAVYHLETFILLSLDDFDQGVVLDVTSQEHFVKFLVDVEGVQDLLAQVEVLFDGDSELSLVLVHGHHLQALELDCLLELEVDQVGPH